MLPGPGLCPATTERRMLICGGLLGEPGEDHGTDLNASQQLWTNIPLLTLDAEPHLKLA